MADETLMRRDDLPSVSDSAATLRRPQPLPQVPSHPPPPYFSLYHPLEEIHPSSPSFGQNLQQQQPAAFALPGYPTTSFNPHSGSSPAPSAPPLDPPPSYSFSQHNDLIREEQQGDSSAPRHKFVLHAYSLLLMLFLLTLTLVATSKALPLSVSGHIYKIPLLHYVAVAVVAASLVVMFSWNVSSQPSIVNHFLLLAQWGGTTLFLILVVKPFSMLAISLTACLTLVTVLVLTLSAIQTKCDLVRHICALLVFLTAVVTSTVLVVVVFGGKAAPAATRGAWIAIVVVSLPLFTQVVVGDRGFKLPTEDFLLAVAILYTLTMILFQCGLFFVNV